MTPAVLRSDIRASPAPSATSIVVLANVLFLGSTIGATERGPAILREVGGLRSAGLAGASVGVPDGVASTFSNPAFLESSARSELLLSRAEAFAGQTRDAFLYGRPLWARGRSGAWSLGVTRWSAPRFDILEEGRVVASARPESWVGAVGVSQRRGNWALGGAVKGVRHALGVSNARAAAVDLGVAGEVGSRCRWGASLTNLGTRLRGGDRSVELPLSARIGGGWRLFEHARGRRRDSFLLALQGDAPVGDRLFGRIGGEYAVRWGEGRRVALRAGVRSRSDEAERAALGFGLGAGDWTMDYAWSPNEATGAVGRWELRWAFGSAPAGVSRREALRGDARAALSTEDWERARAAVDALRVHAPGDAEGERMARLLDRRLADSLDPRALMAEGRRSFEAGDDDRAVERFQKVLLLSPDHADARAGLARAESRRREAQLARWREDVARARRRAWADDVARAEGLMSAGKHAAALPIWRRAQEYAAGAERAAEGREACRQKLYVEAAAREAAGDVLRAQEVYRILRDDEGPGGEAERRLAALEDAGRDGRAALARARYAEGMRFYAAGDLDEAERQFQVALELAPGEKNVRKALDRVREERRHR